MLLVDDDVDAVYGSNWWGEVRKKRKMWEENAKEEEMQYRRVYRKK